MLMQFLKKSMCSVERTCQQCTKQFKIFPSDVKLGRGVYCSRKCRAIGVGLRNRGPIIVRNCQHCSKEFRRTAAQFRNGKYCSRECAIKDGAGIAKNWTRKKISMEKVDHLFDEYASNSRITSIKAFCEAKSVPIHWITLKDLWRERYPDKYSLLHDLKHSNHLYRVGRQFEYRVRDIYKSKGYFVLRSPGSLGPVDLVAIRKGEVLLIQCKVAGYMRPKERSALLELSDPIGGKALCAARGPPPKCKILINEVKP